MKNKKQAPHQSGISLITTPKTKNGLSTNSKTASLPNFQDKRLGVAMPDLVTGQVLTLGFDLDGVIVDHTQKKILLAAAYGHHLTPSQTPAEVIEKILPHHQLDEIKYLLYTHPDEALEHPLMPGVKGVLRFIKQKKIPFYLISRRKSIDTAKGLLKLHNLWPNFFNERNAFFVDGKEDKNVRAKELQITHYLDDEHPILTCLVDVPNKYLFDPHRVWKNFSTYPKIHSWPEVLVSWGLL